MAATLHLRRMRGCDGVRFGRLGAALLRQMERPGAAPVLLVAELQADAVLLGRHQRAASALAPAALRASVPLARRLGGGRALRAGAGHLGVLLALPRIDALVAAPIGAEKVINRYVRGLIAALSGIAGRPVAYFGRDFLSCESRQVGIVSQDGSASGAVVFEALVAVERPLSLPPEWSGYPVHGDPRAAGPEPSCLAALASGPLPEFDAIAERIGAAYGRIHGCESIVDDGPIDEAAIEPPVAEEESGWEESGVADVAIGFVEALVRTEGERIAAARLRGDFIAPAFVLRDLEAALAGSPLVFDAIGRHVDEAFHRPFAAILGVRSLRVLADAVLAAAAALDTKG